MDRSSASSVTSHVGHTMAGIVLTSAFLEPSPLTSSCRHICNPQSKIVIVIKRSHATTIHSTNTGFTHFHFADPRSVGSCSFDFSWHIFVYIF